MAGEIQLNSTTALTEDTGAITLNNVNSATNRTNLGLGSIATQASGSIDIDGGAIDGVTIGTNSAATDVRVDNLKLDGNTISSTNTDGNIVLDPNGTGNVLLGNLTLDADQTVGAGQDNMVLTYDYAQGTIGLEAAANAGTIASQDSDAVAITGGSITGTEFDLKSTGTSVYKSNGSTAVISESGGTATLNNVTLGSGVVFPSDHVIQVVQAKKTTGQSIGSTVTAISGLSQSILVKENSKVLICINLGMVCSPAGADAFFYLYRGGSALSGTTHTDSTTNAHTFGQYIDNSSQYTPVSFMYLDESITSAGTYTYQPYAKSGSGTSITINRRAADTWSGGISTIILMEFSA